MKGEQFYLICIDQPFPYILLLKVGLIVLFRWNAPPNQLSYRHANFIIMDSMNLINLTLYFTPCYTLLESPLKSLAFSIEGNEKNIPQCDPQQQKNILKIYLYGSILISIITNIVSNNTEIFSICA